MPVKKLSKKHVASPVISFLAMSGVEQDFIDVLAEIPAEILKLQGIDKVIPFDMSEEYFKTELVADASIDPNANVSGKSPVNFYSEVFKPQLKLRSYYELWKKLFENDGRWAANQVLIKLLNGTLYFHDITKIDIPYCFAFDTSFILFEGRKYGWLVSRPPKRSSSFIGQVVETTMDFSQQLAGAVGIPNLITNLAYFTRKERAELHRIVDKFATEYEVSLGVAMFLGGLGYSSGKFDFEVDCDKVEQVIQGNMKNGVSTHEAVDRAYDKYVEDLLQQFVHVMHNTFRIGGDSPFTNISIFDREILKGLFSGGVYPDHTKIVDNIEEIIRVQNIFVEFFIKGSPETGKKYRFPVVTVNVKKWTEEDANKGLCSREEVGKIADLDYFHYLVDKNLKRGTFNIHVGEKIASCCRLTSDLSVLKDTVKADTFGNGGISIGSHRVVAVNLHRVAIEHLELTRSGTNQATFKEYFEFHLEMVKMCLVAHKQILESRVKAGFLQFFNHNWCNLNQFFSTIGYTGLWDAAEVLMRCNPGEDLKEYVRVASEMLDTMDYKATEWGVDNPGFAFNVEEIPGENAAPKLAMMDNFYYAGKSWYNKVEMLSNQMIPLYERVSFFDRLEVSSKLMNKVSGGAIVHLNMEDNMTPGSNRDLHRMMVEDYNIPHYAVNIGSTTCVNQHTTIGIHKSCPECNGEIDTYTVRVVGFETDTKDWIKARRNWEWAEQGRQFYSCDNILS